MGEPGLVFSRRQPGWEGADGGPWMCPILMDPHTWIPLAKTTSEATVTIGGPQAFLVWFSQLEVRDCGLAQDLDACSPGWRSKVEKCFCAESVEIFRVFQCVGGTLNQNV